MFTFIYSVPSQGLIIRKKKLKNKTKKLMISLFKFLLSFYLYPSGVVVFIFYYVMIFMIIYDFL